MEGTEFYNVYRNDNSEPIAAVTSADYLDLDVSNGTSYTYYVTSVFLENGEESGPSNLVTVIPMPPITLPFFDDFETGAPYWMMEDTWGLQTGTFHSSAYSLTESPSGDYAANLDISTTLRALDFSWATSASLSFWTRYNLETNYDYMYLEISTNGSDWEEIDSFNGMMNTWVQRQYILDDYLGESNVIIRFRFVSDVYVEEDGMYIDDLEVNVTGVGLDELLNNGKVTIRPNPATDQVTVNFNQTMGGPVKVFLIDESGKSYPMMLKKWVPEGSQEIRLDVSSIMPGIYLLKLETPGISESHKVIIAR